MTFKHPSVSTPGGPWMLLSVKFIHNKTIGPRVRICSEREALLWAAGIISTIVYR